MSFAVGWSYSNISAVAPKLATDYGVSVGAIGFLTTVVLLVYTLLQLPVGRALDRLGARRVGAAGLVVIGLANLLPAVSTSYWVVLGARALLGVGAPLAYLGGLDLIRRLGGSAQLLGAFGAVNGGSMGLALLIVPQLDPWLGFRGPYVSSELFVVVALLAMAPWWAPRTEVAPGVSGVTVAASGSRVGKAGAASSRVSTRELLRDRELLRLAVMNCSSAALSPMVSTWVVTLLVKAGGTSNARAGVIGSITLLGLVASRPVSGWLVQRRPELVRKGIFVSAAMGVGGCAALAVVGPLWLSAIGSLLVGVASAVPWTYVFTRAPHVRPEATGSAFAVVSGIPLTAAIVGVPLIGLTFALPGHGRIGFVVVAALWAVLLFVLPKRPEADTSADPAARAAV